MSLIVLKIPQKNPPRKAGDLPQGTWFVDQYNQVYVIAYDDRTCEKRVVCVGDFCQPFIPNIQARLVDVKAILPIGSQLKVTTIAPLLEGRLK